LQQLRNALCHSAVASWLSVLHHCVQGTSYTPLQ